MTRAFAGEWGFLSNFAPYPVRLEGKIYPTLEHGFAAAKTTDAELREKIRLAPTPRIAKGIGRRLVLRQDWEVIKEEVMRGLLISKFSDTRLASLLLDTGDTELVEFNSWHDVIWGRCGCSIHQGKGENRLGELLMELRGNLRAGN